MSDISKVGAALAASLGLGIDLSGWSSCIPRGSTENKYAPHQGKREIERRLRKASKAKGE